MPDVVLPLDSTRNSTDQEHLGHNRRHPGIPTEVTVRPGESFRMRCREWFDVAIHGDDSAGDVRDVPNSCSTVYIPAEIFDVDVEPSTSGPIRIDPDRGVPRSSF